MFDALIEGSFAVALVTVPVLGTLWLACFLFGKDNVLTWTARTASQVSRLVENVATRLRRSVVAFCQEPVDDTTVVDKERLYAMEDRIGDALAHMEERLTDALSEFEDKMYEFRDTLDAVRETRRRFVPKSNPLVEEDATA